MAIVEEKENIAPATIHDFALDRRHSPVKDARKKPRSHSLGLGGIEGTVANPKSRQEQDHARRQTLHTPAAKPILPGDAEKAARQAERRRTLANRRVSFAPEATLHTWDVIEFMKDQTTSTESSESTHRTNGDRRRNSSSEAESDEDDDQLPSTSNRTATRRSSGIRRGSYNHGDDVDSSSIIGSGSDQSESEQDGESESEDETGTAMSIDVDESTMQSGISASSTSSSARLEAALEQAALTAGTRGIRYDEFGDDESMQLAGDTVTNAFKPWVQNAQLPSYGGGSADQENINPFGTINSMPTNQPDLIYSISNFQDDEEDEDLSMDVTHAIGGILDPEQHAEEASAEDLSMDMTHAIGRIHDQNNVQSTSAGSNNKRRRSTAETGSPMITASAPRPKRRRSSATRTSIGGDATMDLTTAVGSIQHNASSTRVTRRQSNTRHSIAGDDSNHGEMTMDFTQAVGSIKPTVHNEPTLSSVDENEELTMEFTTAIGMINRPDNQERRHMTPENAIEETPSSAMRTPSNPQRFKTTPIPIQGKLLTPLLQKSATPESRRSNSPKRASRTSSVPQRRRTRSSSSQLLTEQEVVERTPDSGATAPNQSEEPEQLTPGPGNARVIEKITYPTLPTLDETFSPIVPQTPVRNLSETKSTPNTNMSQRQAEAQLEEVELSPSIRQQQKPSPSKPAYTDTRNVDSNTAHSLVQSLKLLSTPRKEVLRNISPNKLSSVRPQSPIKPLAIRKGPLIKENSISQTPTRTLPAPRLDEKPIEKIQLHDFLENAGIRFMDLTATKQRLTTAPTPSRVRSRDAKAEKQTLAGAICVSACTVPELEMYRHACNELKHSMSDGKKIIKQLETNAFDVPPALIVAYQQADGALKTELDSRMRDIRTDARLESKSAWYKWRDQLLSDLTQHLTGMGEGLLKDDEIMQALEEQVGQRLPGLTQKHHDLSIESARLQDEATSTLADKENLRLAREKLSDVDIELQEKRELLSKLRREADEQSMTLTDLSSTKKELIITIGEVERVRNASRGVSQQQVSQLRESIDRLEQTLGWTITAANATPTTVTMKYRSELQLFLHPAAFASASGAAVHPFKDPVRVKYIGNATGLPNSSRSRVIRFFIERMQAAFDKVNHSQTLLADIITFASSYWDFAQSVMEAERRIGLETPVSTRIVGGDRVAVDATVLLPKVRTKLRVTFELATTISNELSFNSLVQVKVDVIYGEKYDGNGMVKFVQGRIGDGADDWEIAVRDLIDKLIVQGPAKAARK